MKITVLWLTVLLFSVSLKGQQIDGSKHPESISDEIAWRVLLLNLGNAATKEEARGRVWGCPDRQDKDALISIASDLRSKIEEFRSRAAGLRKGYVIVQPYSIQGKSLAALHEAHRQSIID